jgi:hypothetical protein
MERWSVDRWTDGQQFKSNPQLLRKHKQAKREAETKNQACIDLR